MTTSDSEARVRAVVSLQALLSKHSPGSSQYRIAERALDLAFNGPCATCGNSQHSLLEYARHTLNLQVRAKLIERGTRAGNGHYCSRRQYARAAHRSRREEAAAPLLTASVSAQEQLSGGTHDGGC